jgi:aminoglycoside N3'-acetyltransferase
MASKVENVSEDDVVRADALEIYKTMIASGKTVRMPYRPGTFSPPRVEQEVIDWHATAERAFEAAEAFREVSGERRTTKRKRSKRHED